MTYETILVEQVGNVGLIRLNRPQQRNALNFQLASDILGGLNELENNQEVYVIVIMSAAQGIFCAGADLAEHAALKDDVLGQRRLFGKAAELWLTIPAMSKIVIAAVNGYALAGGCGLAACCDLVVAAENAVFGFPEINVGIFPMTVAPVILRILGLKKCLELFATGDRIGAKEAEKIGLVNKVVPADKLEETAMELAQKLASKSRFSLQMGKKALYNMLDMEYAKAIKYGLEVVSMLAATEDGQEGMKAFLEKRTPKWRR